MSNAEDQFLNQIKAAGIPLPWREYPVCEGRAWRFDFAWPDMMLAVEINGAVYARGRHARGKGLENDYRKLGEALALGWSVYQCSSGMVASGEAIETVGRIMQHLREG